SEKGRAKMTRLGIAPRAFGGGRKRKVVSAAREILVALIGAAAFLVSSAAHASCPYAEGATLVPGAIAGFGQAGFPSNVLGPPEGGGLFTGNVSGVVSLGLAGRVTLEFSEGCLRNGPGFDFTVFENSFLTMGGGMTGPPFAEPAFVSVSADGVVWHEFPCDDSEATGKPGHYPGCAGVYPVLSNFPPNGVLATIPTTAPIADLIGVFTFGLLAPAGSGGDSFDLSGVGLAEARFVRIEASASPFGPTGPGTAGFDLDSVVALHPTVPNDFDGDSEPDLSDNCPALSNSDQSDRDGDGLGDPCDNCVEAANSDSRDEDGDEIGNACDCDYDNDGICGFGDFDDFLADFGLDCLFSFEASPLCPVVDQDGSRLVGFPDFALFLGGFGGAPGPSCCAP
ncbi:MAG: thrombospondin type 3 repeat-containing protein, partial [Vicinamibacteria bacterium]